MDDYHLQLLEQIERGETEFRAEGDTLSDLNAFLRTVHGLKKLEKSGHVEILELHQVKPSDNQNIKCDAVLISLTEFGKRDLAAQRQRKMRRQK